MLNILLFSLNALFDDFVVAAKMQRFKFTSHVKTIAKLLKTFTQKIHNFDMLTTGITLQEPDFDFDAKRKL